MAKKPSNAPASQAAAAVALIQNTAPAVGDASAGAAEVGGDPASGSEGAAASSEQLPARRIIPAFLDTEGKVREINSEDVRSWKMAKNVKIDGVFLEAGRFYWVPADVGMALLDLEAIDLED